MNQLTAVPRLHSTIPSGRTNDVFHLHGSRNYKERGPVVQYHPAPHSTKKVWTPECSHGLRPNYLHGNPRVTCDKQPGCFLPRK